MNNLAKYITEKVFELGQFNIKKKIQRIEFKSGRYPNREEGHGGLCKESFEDFVQKCIEEYNCMSNHAKEGL